MIDTLKAIILNKNYGKKYLVINIIFALLPILASLLNGSKTWSVTLSLFLIYLFSWIFADVSYKQNKKIHIEIDANLVFKTMSFILSILVMLIYVAVNRFTPIPLESLYIFGYGIVSLFLIYYMIIKGEIKDEVGKKRIFFNKMKEIIFGTSQNRIKAIIDGFILVICSSMLLITAMIIYIYKGLNILVPIIKLFQ